MRAASDDPSAPPVPSASSAPLRTGMLTTCRRLLFVLSALTALTLLLLHATSTASTTSDADTATHSALHHWLQLHPPRQASHDAELLRRRRLGAMIEFLPSELAEHVPAIVASLGHTDGHIRRLAMGMTGMRAHHCRTTWRGADSPFPVLASRRSPGACGSLCSRRRDRGAPPSRRRRGATACAAGACKAGCLLGGRACAARLGVRRRAGGR